MHQVWIGLGSNLGEREAYLAAGAKSISSLGNAKFASVYETAPQFPRGIDAPGGPFLNTVCRLETDCNVFEVFVALGKIESRNLRTRSFPFSPRTLDLDLLGYDQLCMRRGIPPAQVSGGSAAAPLFSSLSIPHPRMHRRRFVLVPLAELDPSWQHPLLRRNSRELLQGLEDPSSVKWHCASSDLSI